MLKRVPPRSRHGGLQEPGAALFAQPVAVATDREDMAVVQQPVEDRGRHHGVAEHRVIPK
jgi:hypothetical protein